jgi:hypothetical protein
MNVYGLSGCFILLALVPLAAVLHERSLRRNGYAEDIDGTIQGNRRLPRHDKSKCSPDRTERISPDPRPPVPNAGRVA